MVESSNLRSRCVHSRARSVACAALSMLAAVASSCGARTELSQPCAIPLEREKPVVVFLVKWDAQCNNERGGCSDEFLYDGRDLIEVVRHSLAHILPVLDDVARIGAMPTQTIRFGDPEPGSGPDGGWDPGWCATPPGLTVAIGEGHGPRVEEYFSPEQWPFERRPNGQGSVLPNLPVVERELLAVGTDRTPRFLILIDSGRCGCPGDPGCSVHFDEADYAEVRARFAALVSRGIRTLVVGMRRFGEPDHWPQLNEIRLLSAEAEGGGLARADDGREPILFYEYTDVPAIEAVLHERIVRPFYCTLYPTAAVRDPDAVVLIAPGGGEAPPRDPTHRDGWDFLDATHGTIGLFGGACERAISSPRRLSLLVPGLEAT